MKKLGRPLGSVNPNSKRSQLLAYLERGFPIMHHTASELFGMKNLPQYIESLRDRGYEILAEWTSDHNKRPARRYWMRNAQRS